MGHLLSLPGRAWGGSPLFFLAFNFLKSSILVQAEISGSPECKAKKIPSKTLGYLF